MDDFRKVEWVLKFSGWPGTTMSGEIGYPPKLRTFGSPEHDPAENKPLDRGPRRAARLVSPRSLPMRLLLQSAQFLLRRYREGFCLLFWIHFSTWVSDGGESCRDLLCYKKKKIRKIFNTFFVWFSWLRTSGRKEAWRKARQRYAHNVGGGLSAEEEITDVSGCRWGSLELRILQL